ERPEELAVALVQLLDDKSPDIRRGAARLIGAASAKVDLSEVYYPNERSANPKPNSQTGHAPEKSKAGAWLEKRNVQKRLKSLSANDADPGVRAAAQRSLEQLARLQEKKP